MTMTDNRACAREVNLLVAIDWATDSHYYFSRDRAGAAKGEAYIPNSAEGFDALLARLDAQRAGGKVAVIFEATKGAILYALLGVDWLVPCPVNPVKTKKLNELDGSGRGKSDPRDARLLCDYLALKLDELLESHVETDSLALRLREAVGLEADLVGRCTKLKQRIAKQINTLCPPLNALIGDLEAKVYRRYLLEHSPLDPSPRERIVELLRSHRVGDAERIEDFAREHCRLRCLGRDRELQREQLESLRCSVRLLEAALQELRLCERRIDALFGQLPQAPIYRSMPSVGPRLAPRLASLFGSRPEKTFACKQQANAYLGQSPLTLQTGAKDNRLVIKRMNCHKGARNVIYLWARVCNMRESSGWQGAYLSKLKERGDRAPTRYRKLGCKLVGVLYRCLVDNVCYDPSIYAKNMRQKA